MKIQKIETNNNTMTILIDVQYASTCKDIPDETKIISWAKLALSNNMDPVEFTIRIVDEDEILELNHKWRGIEKSTNVLSFPAGENIVAPELLGDIAICAPVINREATEQEKLLEAHWAHMVIHGVLHLLGYDHNLSEDAEKMESQEIEFLKTLNFPNPYE